MSSAKGRLNYMVKELELCARFCHIFPGKGACFHYHLKQCRGACAEVEAVADYNERALQAMERMKTVFDNDFLLLDQGRNEGEQAVVLVKEGHFAGFGYIDADSPTDKASLMDAVKHYPAYPDTARIIQRFMSNHPKTKVVKLG